MDNHPIPQDVTGFQFRLIGDMTIKQFAYLAAGMVLAWICLYLPVFILFKLPLVAFFALFGFIFAFVPIGGRPADAMLFYFFRAVFSPAQYVYKQTQQTSQTTSVGNAPKEKEKKESETIHLENIQVITPAPTPMPMQEEPPTSPSHREIVGETEPTPITPEETPAQTGELNQEAEALMEKLQEAKQEEKEAQGQQEISSAHQKVHELETELQSVYQQKQQLEEQLVELQRKLAQQSQQVFAPSTAQPPKATENVRKIPASMGKAVGTPFITDTPNLISGIVKDPRGNVLPNMLIEVKDKDNNPVRAFKTNPLGQFASATPVMNGVYTITFEDPQGKQKFDTVEITANGEVMQPLEVISVDAREELRKELFG